MKIKSNTVVRLNYKLRKDSKDGDLIEETYGKEPLSFIFGIGQMIPAFEENIKGLSPKNSFSFGIEAKKAYGLSQEAAIVEIPIETFKIKDDIDKKRLRPGRVITIQDKKGKKRTGRIIKTQLTSVTIDFNHPMAGQNLYFSGEIISVRNVTESELEHGHVHGAGGHQH